MDRRSADHEEFGAGFNLEDGAYPEPPQEYRTSTERSSQDTKSNPAESPSTVDSEYGTFRGKIVSIVPPSTIHKRADGADGLERSSYTVASVYLMRGSEWVRVAFWGDAAEQVLEYESIVGEGALKVTGLESPSKDIRSLHIFDNDQNVKIEKTSGEYRIDPQSWNASDIDVESLVPCIVGRVVRSTEIKTHQDSDGEKFDVQSVCIDVDGDKVALEIYDSHLPTRLLIDDTVCVLAGWGKSLEYRDHDLPDVEYRAKIWARDYSGLWKLESTRE